jgi:hypothetical protein
MNKLGYMLAAVGALALLALGGYAGQWWAERGQQNVRARTSVQTDTVWRDRPIAAEDTATRAAQAGTNAGVARASMPREVVRYETRVDTVRDCYARPDSFRVAGLASSRPVRIEPDGLFSGPSVTLTTFDPRASRFEQRVYDVPEPEWELWPDLAATYGPHGTVGATAAVHLRYRRVEVWGGYRFAKRGRESRIHSGVAAGVRVRPFTLDW